MNSVVSTSLLYYDLPEVTFGMMKKTIHSLYKYIKMKKWTTYISCSPQNYDIKVGKENNKDT